jgi:Na+/H+-translocating membrane pyrophosphatase
MAVSSAIILLAAILIGIIVGVIVYQFVDSEISGVLGFLIGAVAALVFGYIGYRVTKSVAREVKSA